MTYELLMQEAQGISDELMQEVIRFIRFLKVDVGQNKSETESAQVIKFDAFAGGLEYISDDFDSTLETFEEYI